MGNLTTLTIYNDGIDLIPRHAQEFADDLYKASQSMTGPQDISVGNFCNLVKVQKTRHADDATIYVHMGNTVCEMSQWSSETKRIMREHPAFFDRMLQLMRNTVNDLEYQRRQATDKETMA